MPERARRKKSHITDPFADVTATACDILGVDLPGSQTPEKTGRKKCTPPKHEVNPFIAYNQNIEAKSASSRKGGLESVRRRRMRKTFKETVEFAMSLPAIRGNVAVDILRDKYPDLTYQDAMVIAVAAQCVKQGDARSLAVLRDTMGEAPMVVSKEAQLASGNTKMVIEVKTLGEGAQDPLVQSMPVGTTDDIEAIDVEFSTLPRDDDEDLEALGLLDD